MKFIKYVFLVLSLSLTCHAELSKKEIKLWQDKIFNHINGIKTLKANLVQSSSNGDEAQATFWLNKSSREKYGRMRLVYSSQNKLTYWSDGKNLYQYDDRVKETTTHPIENTPAFFLLQKDLKMTRDFYVKKADFHNDLLGMTFVQRGYEDSMEFTVFFKTKPILQLHGWVVKDCQNSYTQVVLEKPQVNIPLEDKLFEKK